MTTKKTTTKKQQLSRGQRKHVRKLKQEARQAGTAYRSPFAGVRGHAVPKNQTPTAKSAGA